MCEKYHLKNYLINFTENNQKKKRCYQLGLECDFSSDTGIVFIQITPGPPPHHTVRLYILCSSSKIAARIIYKTAVKNTYCNLFFPKGTLTSE